MPNRHLLLVFLSDQKTWRNTAVEEGGSEGNNRLITTSG
jgi:hypothetical protein